jgi:hypothetical protein
MKHITLVTLLGFACTSIALAGEAFQHEYENGGYWEAMPRTTAARIQEDSSHWIHSQMVWNEEYDTFDILPVLNNVDVFQERMVWSNHYTDFVPVGMALRAIYEQPVWSSKYAAFVPSGLVTPCPQLTQQTKAIRLAALD